ncbi:UNVERIFIED_CONTAM: hypothetical protein GTU68_026302, partial [Idotea baltica]|nr:hypothetical protein [Idotea baltica]
MSNNYLDKINNADVYDVAIKTPLEKADKLSKRFENSIYLKREDLQPVFSFKLRGAYNKISKLTSEERERGVIAASAGNHAQGVALSAQKLNCKAKIVMPIITPEIKVIAVKSLGAEVILSGESFQEAQTKAEKICKDENLVFIHPFDDPDVIAGQGTIAKEIHKQFKSQIDYVFVCLGGGGLVSGILEYFKAVDP